MARKPHVRHEAARVHHAARRNGGRLPVAARAQGARNLPKVGFLFPGTERIAPTRIAQMAEGLRAVGYRAPDQIELIARVTGGDPSRVAPMASSMRPAYLRSELVTPSKLEAAKMPTLHGLDEEFGQVAGVNQLDRTRSILLAGALGAAILGGLTLAWLAVDGSVRPKVASSAPTSPRNTAPVESRELVDRLLSQVEALKSEVRKLTEAQQQPAHAIAAIEAEQESRNRAPPVHWYSDPAALSSGLESRPEPWGVVPLPRRPASPRPTLR